MVHDISSFSWSERNSIFLKVKFSQQANKQTDVTKVPGIVFSQSTRERILKKVYLLKGHLGVWINYLDTMT